MNNGNPGCGGAAMSAGQSVENLTAAILDGGSSENITDNTTPSMSPGRRISSVNAKPSVPVNPGSPLKTREPAASGAPLSDAQRRWWLLEQLEPGTAIPCFGFRLRLQGPLDVDALEASFAAIVDRHEVLRSVFAVVAGQPVQVAMKNVSFRLAKSDLGAIERETRARLLDRLAREDAGQPFDLSSDLLMRARLVRLAEHDHVLQVVLHPLAGDGGSVGVLCRDLGAYYQAFSDGTVPLLPELPMRYADHALLERERTTSRLDGGDEQYWKERLTGAPAVLALPTDRPRPPAQSRKAGVCEAKLPADLFEKTKAFADAESASVAEVLLAAYQAVLHRYTGQDDLVVGVTHSTRRAGQTDGLVGPFENTLPVRVRLKENANFRELVAEVRDSLRGAGAHGEYAFERMLESVHIRREPSHEPLCQASFSMDELSDASPRVGELGTRLEPVFTGAFAGDLALRVHGEASGLRLCAEFSTDLLEAGTLERLLGHFLTLLESALSSPEQAIAHLQMLTAEEQTRVLRTWNATAVEYPRDRFVHQLFEDQAARTPHAVAVVFNDTELTYAELDRRAESVAMRLRSAGIGPDTPVALCAERSIEMVAGLLGILKAGAAYVPLDPAFPADRLAFMLEDSCAPVLVTQRRLEPLFGEKNISVLLLDEAAPPSAGRSDDQPGRRAPSPDDLAYILYTSGSTGRPKGVMVTHRNVVNFFAGMDAVLGREPGVWLAVTSISFDISVLELFWTLTRGFRVVLLADQAGMKTAKVPGAEPVKTDESLRSLDEQLARHAVTHLQCTPSFARLLTRMPETLAALRPLRRMLIGGEGLPADLAQTLVDALEGKLVNMYGPTETTVWSTTHEVNEVRSSVVDIGRPIANTDIYILDAHRQPVPVGVPGELYIGGDGVARGYWRRPELTEERFVADPFKKDERIYRTGDLARYRSDGVIEFIGRADHQVKIRGHRIELGEIEAVLAQHPDVAQCVVVVRTDNPADPRLAAYLVSSSARKKPDADVLKDFVAEKLPAHMVPEFFVMMERLPLTPNGKIDRKALPAPVRPAAPATEVPAAPGTLQGIERAISSIWREILEVDQLDGDDNFFDSGGRSLHVVEVKNRLQERLGVEVPVIRLFQYPTIRSLAGFIGSQAKSQVAAKL